MKPLQGNEILSAADANAKNATRHNGLIRTGHIEVR